MQILFQVDVVQDDKAHCSATALAAVTHREWCPSRKAPTYIWVTSSGSLIPLHPTLLSLSLSPTLSTHTRGQREGVHFKAEMSKEQDSQALMSDCPADSTPVHKGVCVGSEVRLAYTHFIYMHTRNGVNGINQVTTGNLRAPLHDCNNQVTVKATFTCSWRGIGFLSFSVLCFWSSIGSCKWFIDIKYLRLKTFPYFSWISWVVNQIFPMLCIKQSSTLHLKSLWGLYKGPWNSFTFMFVCS